MEDRGTYLTFGGGLVFLVVVATGLSSIMDGRKVSWEMKSQLREQVVKNDHSLQVLRGKLDEARKEWAKVGGRRNLDGSCKSAKKTASERAVKISQLVARKAGFNAEIAQTDAAFGKYRSQFRLLAWQAAVGETVGDLRTLDGREYRGVSISRVTDDGVEIRHENGVARIVADHLAPTWHKRFQWRWSPALSKVD